MNPSNPTNPTNPTILLTFDVEDWFQVENLRSACPIFSWPRQELRVERNTHRILDLLDNAKCRRPAAGFPNSTNPTNSTNPINPCNLLDSPKATFFVLGWIAHRVPGLVREIHARGHEVASHGYFHHLLGKCSDRELEEDLVKSKRMLEDMVGEEVDGYRAPGFSVSDSALNAVERAGYLYDSSYNSFAPNPRYGKISLDVGSRQGIAYKLSDGFYELPVSNLILSLIPFHLRPLNNPSNPSNPTNPSNSSNSSNPTNPMNSIVLPWGGGGYFRVIPSSIFNGGIRSILKKQGAYLFYLHPWEVDADQPRVRSVSLMHRFRHYVNLGKTCEKLARLLEDFNGASYLSCRQYVEGTDWCSHLGTRAQSAMQSNR